MSLSHEHCRDKLDNESGAAGRATVQPHDAKRFPLGGGRAVHRRGRPAGTLRLNCWVEAARQILVPVVLEYQRRYPEVAVDIVTDGQLIDIVAKGFDAGIRTRDAAPGDMIAVPFGPELRFVVVGSPAYLRDLR
jgi:DNA-binding transcriptional LysR family regulator